MARSLGLGRIRTFLRITLGQARGAILGGCVLVALVILAEYGAFEILGYQTFTTEIFTEFQVSFNVPTASALSLVLVVLSLFVLGADASFRGRGRVARTGPFAQQVAPRYRLGRAKLPVLAGFVALVGLALGVPVGACVYWIFEGGAHSLTGVSIVAAAWHTALYSGTAAALATLMALPVALLAVRHVEPRRPTPRAQHVSGAGHARPGDRSGAQLLLRALRQRVRLPERAPADLGLRHLVLPAGPGRRCAPRWPTPR